MKFRKSRFANSVQNQTFQVTLRAYFVSKNVQTFLGWCKITQILCQMFFSVKGLNFGKILNSKFPRGLRQSAVFLYVASSLHYLQCVTANDFL